MQRSTRRRFLAQTAAGMAALAAVEPLDALAETAKHPPIMDTHQHLWDFRRFQPPWLKDVPALNRSHTLADYRKAAAGLNIVKAIYMEVDVAVDQQQQEADYLIELCRSRKSSTVAAVVSGRPASPNFAAYARQFQGSPYIKGIRQVLQVPECERGYCLQPAFVKSIQLLGDLGLSYDVCMRREELSDGAKLVDLCPKTRFVLDHCGNADAHAADQESWRRDITELAKRPNLICKVSGIIRTCKPGEDKARALEPIVRHVLDSFGWDRVVFGSDWPVCDLGGSLKEWVTALRWIVRDASPEQQRKLFYDNAARFYRVS